MLGIFAFALLESFFRVKIAEMQYNSLREILYLSWGLQST